MGLAIALPIRHFALMPRTREPIDDMIDAHVWMRRQEARRRICGGPGIDMNFPRQGRNDPCSCGSGKKYKHCHGSPNYLQGIADAAAAAALQRKEAAEAQRQKQQGLGRPIISAAVGDVRFVAVKNRVHWANGTQTFHDWLIKYARAALGEVWGNAEIAKPEAEKHPIIVWYQKMCLHQKRFIKEPGKVHQVGMTGAMRSFLQLAYDLYALEHNAELQAILLGRLRSHDQFSGAANELHVAAMFVRAGFDIKFEDETDRLSRHCEFTATHRKTGRSFSVEAKKQESKKLRIVRLFRDALTKDANHPRVIFIEYNSPYKLEVPVPAIPATAFQDTPPAGFPPFLVRAQKVLRRFEKDPQSAPLPPAYVFVTNFTASHHLDDEPPPSAAVVDSFKIPDFKGQTSVSLREAIDARKKHIEMHELMQSFQEHEEIPSTFDGENPEFAFGGGSSRIIIGERYKLDGVDQPITITTAIVMEKAKKAMCGGVTDDGQWGVYQIPLSDVELAAWRRHPETFFGKVIPTRSARGPLEMYDFFHESLKATSKENLLKDLESRADYEHLKSLSQEQLADLKAEWWTLGTMAQGKQGQGG
jgi:SEC-C motif